MADNDDDADHPYSFPARIPSDVPEENQDLALHELLHSSETLLHPDASQEVACGLLAKVLQDCAPEACKKMPHVTSEESLKSGEKLAREVMGEVLRKATKGKMSPKIKKPKMKSGWMQWDEIFANFVISDEVFKNIMFNENLLVSTFEKGQVVPTPIGALSLDIQGARGGPLKYQRKKNRSDFLCPKFLVHLSSQLDSLGHNGGSRITSWVDRDLQTLEEKRREYVKLDDGLDQQALYVNAQENFYYLRHDKNKDIFHNPQRAKNLICEGANFVLMRYLALTKFVGTFEVTTLYIDGSLCRNIYECKGPSSGTVNDKKLDVCKIYRTVIEKCGIEHRSITLMTLAGQILKQEWRFCNYILQVNPLLEVSDKKPTGHDRVPLENKAYFEDLQLLSLYLDAKSVNKKLILNYMEDHPEIKDLLADYVQTILQLKPADVFEFTAKYFLAFTPALLPQTEYFEGPFDVDDEDDYDFWKYI